MPMINIRIAKDDNVTPDQKASLIQKMTQLLADELGKNPATTNVVIDEVNPDNWGVGGTTVSQIRKQNN